MKKVLILLLALVTVGVYAQGDLAQGGFFSSCRNAIGTNVTANTNEFLLFIPPSKNAKYAVVKDLHYSFDQASEPANLFLFQSVQGYTLTAGFGAGASNIFFSNPNVNGTPRVTNGTWVIVYSTNYNGTAFSANYNLRKVLTCTTSNITFAGAFGVGGAVTNGVEAVWLTDGPKYIQGVDTVVAAAGGTNNASSYNVINPNVNIYLPCEKPNVIFGDGALTGQEAIGSCSGYYAD